MSMEQHTYVRATFTPKRLDDLKPEAKHFIGKAGVFQAGWIIEEGPYKGQWAMLPDLETSRRFHVGWVPEDDLTVLETLAAIDVFPKDTGGGKRLAELLVEAKDASSKNGTVVTTPYEVMVFDRALSAAETRQVEDYLRKKYMPA